MRPGRRITCDAARVVHGKGAEAQAAMRADRTPKTYMAAERKIRVLVAKPGLDGHDRGAKVLARALRDAGMEVIYTGIRQTPQMIVEAAVQEDVDAILLSILSGAHMAIFPKVMELLKQNGVDDVLVMAGGILPDEDIPTIEALGIEGNFGPGTPMSTIIEYVRAHIRPERLTHELEPVTNRGAAIDPSSAEAGSGNADAGTTGRQAAQ
jgi:methylmalonyl-CoA mutase C-terminal domain/subunit